VALTKKARVTEVAASKN